MRSTVYVSAVFIGMVALAWSVVAVESNTPKSGYTAVTKHQPLIPTETVRQLYIGMPEAEVMELIGIEPADTSVKTSPGTGISTKLVWWAPERKQNLNVTFKDGKVHQVDFISGEDSVIMPAPE